MERKVRLLYTEGKGRFHEREWIKPEITADEIEVQAAMTGICRSDIDMMMGQFSLPLHMQGHEGLGIVTDVGANITDIKVGDFVATRGEPAYADYYNVRRGEYVQVPELDPAYIVEPVACAINVFNSIDFGYNPSVCILGTGFLASIVYQQFGLNRMLGPDVIGNHNRDYWARELAVTIDTEVRGRYDVVIDLSGKDVAINGDILRENGQLILAAAKHPAITTTFDNWLWKAITVKCPSPRNAGFLDCMKSAVEQIETGKLDIDGFWTRGYNRDTEWEAAFADGLNRNKNYNRGFFYVI